MRRTFALLLALLTLWAPATAAAARSLPATIYSVTADSPFGGTVVISGATTSKLSSVQFTVTSKVGATAKAISATYSAAYLASISAIDAGAGRVTVPIFGLYQNYANSVTITYKERSGSARLTASISTDDYHGTFAAEHRETIVSRNAAVQLDYSYMVVKQGWLGTLPTVIDIDGNVRWVFDAGAPQNAYLWDGELYYASGTSVRKMKLGGASSLVVNLAGEDVAGFHHNFDPGKRGLLLEVDTNIHSESTIIEIDKSGNVLETFDVSAIIRAAMTSDDLATVNSTWIRDGVDWFHNNAATYWKKYDTLVLSSRENFVIGIGYSDKKIKWILGDTNKGWYQDFNSLKKYALTLSAGSLPPIGEHAVSITANGELMLFDNGANSFNQCCIQPGSNRGYSAPRRYAINPKRMTADETWRYSHSPVLNSAICSSVYESGKSLLIDYAHADNGGSRFVGLGKNDAIAFEWKFNGYDCGQGWNARPISLESLSY